MSLLLPTPDAKGVDQLKEVYRTLYDRELSDEEATELLTRLMRLIYLTSREEDFDGAPMGGPADNADQGSSEKAGVDCTTLSMGESVTLALPTAQEESERREGGMSSSGAH
jgi:hypothetical protein